MIPVPSITTLVCGPTMIWAPPMNALTVITTSWAANFASRRSRSAPPIIAKTDICAGTTQTPLRSKPLRIATWVSRAGPVDDRRGLRRGAGLVPACAGRSSGDRHQVGVGAGGVRRLEPLVELVEVDAALARGLPEDLGDLVPVRVGDAQLRRVGVGARAVPPCRPA